MTVLNEKEKEITEQDAINEFTMIIFNIVNIDITIHSLSPVATSYQGLILQPTLATPHQGLILKPTLILKQGTKAKKTKNRESLIFARTSSIYHYVSIYPRK